MGYAVFGKGDIFLGLGQLLGVRIAYGTSFENFASFLYGVGAVSFKFSHRVAFLFRVAAACVICSEVFGGVSTLGSGAGCGWDGSFINLGSSAGSFFSG